MYVMNSFTVCISVYDIDNCTDTCIIVLYHVSTYMLRIISNFLNNPTYELFFLSTLYQPENNTIRASYHLRPARMVPEPPSILSLTVRDIQCTHDQESMEI